MVKKYLSGTKIVLWMFERKVISIWKVILKVQYILTHAEYEASDKLIKRFKSKFNDSEFLKEIGFVEYISLLLCWTYTVLHKQVASRPLTSVHLPFPPCFNNLLSCTFVICFPNPVNNCVEYVKIFIFPNNSVFQWIVTKFKTILKFY